MDTQTRRSAIAWLRQFGGLLFFYLACLGGMLWAQHASAAGWIRVTLTVLPIFPGCALIWATVSSYRRADEFVRLHILRAATLAATVTALWTLVYSFLQPLGLPLLPVGVVHAVGWPIFVWQMVRLIRLQ
jgi:hypothetical protein